VVESKVSMKMFRLTSGNNKRHIMERFIVCTCNTVMVLKSRTLKLNGHVVLIEEIIIKYIIFVRKPQGKEKILAHIGR